MKYLYEHKEKIKNNIKTLLVSSISLFIGYHLYYFTNVFTKKPLVTPTKVHTLTTTEISITPAGDVILINREGITVNSVLDSSLTNQLYLYLQLYESKNK